MRIADQFQEVMIFDMLDLVSQTDKTAVNVIERAAVELVSQLPTTNRQRVTAGMLPAPVWNRARPPIAES